LLRIAPIFALHSVAFALMIVIVIVGILSSVALPNFLNQTNKAKATECNAKIGAILSNVSAEHLRSSADAAALLASEITDANTNSTNCVFADASLTAPLYGITAAGDGTELKGYDADSCVNGDTSRRDLEYTTDGTEVTAALCS
jgi:type IV pilus assembly protein PilA